MGQVEGLFVFTTVSLSFLDPAQRVEIVFHFLEILLNVAKEFQFLLLKAVAMALF